MVESILRSAARLPAWLVVALTGGFALADSAFLVDLLVPGEAGMVFLGATGAERGIAVVVLIGACAAGAVAGDSLGFLIGRRWGWALVCRWDWVRRRVAPKVRRAEKLFESRSGSSVVAGRWVGALRAVMPLVAGASKMPYRRFLLWDCVGALTWSPAIVATGYYLGRPAVRFVDRFDWIIPALLAVAATTWWLLSRRKRRSTSRR